MVRILRRPLHPTSERGHQPTHSNQYRCTRFVPLHPVNPSTSTSSQPRYAHSLASEITSGGLQIPDLPDKPRRSSGNAQAREVALPGNRVLTR